MSEKVQSNNSFSSNSDIPELKGATFHTQQSQQSEKLGHWESFKDSFRRQQGPEEKGPKKQLSTRHIVMIALSTGVGTGLWVGTGKSLAGAGPGSLLIGYAIVSSMMYFVIDAAGELAVAYGDIPGAFNAYPRKFIDESLGFAIAWNYGIQWLTVFALELVTACMTLKYWTEVNSDIFVAPFYFLVVFINFFGAKGYGEAEFFFNSTKLITLAGFFIFALCIDTGRGGDNEYIGAKYWSNPGAFHHGFKGLCSVFVAAAFAFGGTEFVALTAADQSNPKKVIPQAIKVVCYRIIFIFMVSLTMITMLVPYNSPKLLGSSGSSATQASPFVIAAASHGVKVIPHIINSVILLSVLSVANSAVYSSSRTLQSLAIQGFAPKMFNYIDKAGRPLIGLITASLFGCIAFVASSDKQEDVFTWLLSISGLSTIFTFTSICLSHIRFRRAMRVQGISTKELGYTATFGEWGSIYASVLNVLIIIAQFYIALFPLGSDKPNALNFFQNYLGAVVLMVFYVGHKLYSRNWRLWIPASEIDLQSDRKIFDTDLMEQEEFEQKEYVKNSNFLVKVQNFFC